MLLYIEALKTGGDPASGVYFLLAAPANHFVTVKRSLPL
jgi:hypothetical protein